MEHESPASDRQATPKVAAPSLTESFPNVNWEERADAPVRPLTKRELDVLRYLPTRLSNVDIGERLRISQNTVKTHLKDIYKKLRVSSRNDAVVAAIRVGLLSVADDHVGRHENDQGPDR